MRRLLPIVAWLLAALWLPANLHCAMETTGGAERAACCGEHSAAPAAAAEDDHCAQDHCAVVEQGAPQQRDELTLAAPLLLGLEAAAAPETVTRVAATVAPVNERGCAPAGAAASWRFERRAAWPARAP